MYAFVQECWGAIMYVTFCVMDDGLPVIIVNESSEDDGCERSRDDIVREMGNWTF